MRKIKIVLILLLAAALAVAGYSFLSGKEEKVKKIDVRELPEGVLDQLEEVRPEIDGFHFDSPREDR